MTAVQYKVKNHDIYLTVNDGFSLFPIFPEYFSGYFSSRFIIDFFRICEHGVIREEKERCIENEDHQEK